MNRLTESELLGFCVQQRQRVELEDWVSASKDQPERLALVAFLLASTPWYGSRDLLLRVAERLRPVAVTDFSELVQVLNFDCARFVQSLQTQLAYEGGV